MTRNETAMALLVFDGDHRLIGWNDAAAALPALAGALIGGTPRTLLDPLLTGVPAMDRPLVGGGMVRTLGPGAGMTGTHSSRLFAAASHDLRQPLAALSLLVGALDGRASDPAAREVLRAMGVAVQSMKTMVDGHLDLARLESGLIDPDLGSHPINGILTRAALEFAPRFAGRGVRFSVMPCSAMVETDPLLLERLLHALLSNALAQTDRGRVVLGCRRRGEELAIGVWDSGRGLAPGPLHTLRQALEHPDGQERARVLGLGLTLARGLAHRMGHRLTVDSRPGLCTVFSILARRVPDGDDHHLPAPTAADPTLDVSHARVLIIEDDALVLGALRVLLGQWGCAVSGAESFDAAMALLGPRPTAPDLIIADLRLRGAANGIVAIRQLSKALDRPIAGLILTGDTDPARLREARLSGYPLLHKPVAPLALRTAVANLLGHRRSFN